MTRTAATYTTTYTTTYLTDTYLSTVTATVTTTTTGFVPVVSTVSSPVGTITGTTTSTSTCPAAAALRRQQAALLAAPNPTPASGTVSVWVQGTEIGHGTLDAAGHTTIHADTSTLRSGDYELSFRYGGDANFAATETTGPLTVQAAQTSVSTPAGPSTTVVTTSGPELASTGPDPWWPLLVAVLLLLGGGSLLVAGRLGPRGHH